MRNKILSIKEKDTEVNNTDIEEYCHNDFLPKNYYEIFKNKLIVGMNLGVATIVTSPINLYDDSVEYPFLRFMEVAESNILEEFYWSTIPTNYSDFHTPNALVANPLARGMVRTNKFITNIWMKNILINMFMDPINKEDSTLSFIKICSLSIVARTGSEAIIAIEKKLTDPIDKIIYTGSLLTSIFAISLLFSPDISYKNSINGATYLSSQNIAKVSGGFIASYFVLDTYLYASENIPLYQEVVDSVSVLSRSITLAAMSGAIIAHKFSLGERQKAISQMKTMFIFSIAKGVGVTLIEVADDYMGLSKFVSGSINSGLTSVNKASKIILDYTSESIHSGLSSVNEAGEFISGYMSLSGLISIDDYVE